MNMPQSHLSRERISAISVFRNKWTVWGYPPKKNSLRHHQQKTKRSQILSSYVFIREHMPYSRRWGKIAGKGGVAVRGEQPSTSFVREREGEAAAAVREEDRQWGTSDGEGGSGVREDRRWRMIGAVVVWKRERGRRNPRWRERESEQEERKAKP